MMTALLFATIAIVLALLAGLAAIWRRRRPPAAGAMLAPLGASDPSHWFFNRPDRWLVVKCSDILKVQHALGLHNPIPCPLHEGFARTHERRLFISPPIKGWILVVGNSLPDPADDVDKLYHFLMKIARALGSVQYFSADRVLNHHAWARLENGQIYRAYAWADETLWLQGERTAAEIELGLNCQPYATSPSAFPHASREDHAAKTAKLTLLAARWSVDPASVLDQETAFGIAGDLSRRG